MKTDTEYTVLGAPYPKYARPDPMASMNHDISEYLVLSVSLDTGDDRLLARCSEYPQGEP